MGDWSLVAPEKRGRFDNVNHRNNGGFLQRESCDKMEEEPRRV